MKFFKIKNNTANSIIISNTCIEPNSDTILSEEAVAMIDNQYFNSNILINLGLIDVNKDFLAINPSTNQFYKKPPTGIPRNHLDRDVNSSLKRADNSIQKGLIGLNDLSNDLKNLLQNNSTSLPTNTSNSVVIKERQLEESVRNSLDKANKAFDKAFEKVKYDDLSEDLKYLIDESEDDSYWKDPVDEIELLPQMGNTNGDVRLVLSNGTLWRWNTTLDDKWDQILGNSSTSNGQYIEPSISARYVIGEFFAEEGQQIFKAQKSFTVDTNNLQVMLNGILMTKEEDYLEIDEHTVQFLYPLCEDDYVLLSVAAHGQDPFVVVETIDIEENKTRIVKFKHAFDPSNAKSLQVFLNGILVLPGEESDFMFYNSSSINFNYDLEIEDRITVRFESSSLYDNMKVEFSNIQKIYQGLSKQIKVLRETIESKL
ncbi:hypothetical protein D3C81_607190 [compost metagenome]